MEKVRRAQGVAWSAALSAGQVAGRQGGLQVSETRWVGESLVAGVSGLRFGNAAERRSREPGVWKGGGLEFGVRSTRDSGFGGAAGTGAWDEGRREGRGRKDGSCDKNVTKGRT
jgi:hypothetical protein